MYINLKDFLILDENKLIKFLHLKITEDMYLDYKIDLPSIEKRKTHKEFLKDVTAFSNANGGNILIGVMEPSDELEIDEQLQGIEKADEWAQDLERLTVSSIDPRISGLKIKAIPLSNGKSVIAIFIPPSFSRPHMVNYDRHRTFYIRHSESSFPMTSNEIRQSIMQTITLEENVKKYFLDKEEDIRNYFLDETPTFLIQAMPIIPLEPLWEIYDEKIEDIVRGSYLEYSSLFCPKSNINPKATIDGILGTDSRQNSIWQTEIHRNGYVSYLYRNQFISSENKYIVYSDFKYFFYSFVIFIEAILSVTQTDLPYIIFCKYFGADKTSMLIEKPFKEYSTPYYKEVISFPLHYRQIGEGFVNIADSLCSKLFNAYGYKKVRD